MTAYGYTLYKRDSKRKGRPIYYVQFRDGRTGRRLPGRSTGLTSKNEARRWCESQLRDGYYVGEGEMRFSEYAKDWWIWDRCQYIRRKLDKHQAFSKRTAEMYRCSLQNHILPFFEHYKLNRIGVDLVETFLHHLREHRHSGETPLSGKSINNILSVLRVMMQRAVELGYVVRNPVQDVFVSPSINQTERTALSVEEAHQILDLDRINSHWRSKKYFALNLVAAVCGLRLGECRGLQQSHLKDGMIHVTQAWSDKHGLHEPKCGSSRIVPVPHDVEALLYELMDESPFADDPERFIFHGDRKDVPMDNSMVNAVLYETLQVIGITSEERKRRNITFHSWRHYFVTNMRGQIPEPLLKSVVGHKMSSVTDMYTHFGSTHLDEVRPIQSRLYRSSRATM